MAFAADGGFEMARKRHKPEEIVAHAIAGEKT
jgi:hypothetical protein